MAIFDPRRDRLLPSMQASAEAKLSDRQFSEYEHPGSRLPVCLFPPVARRGTQVERYLAADLRLLRGGVIL